MAGELYHPVALFPTANKFGGQAEDQMQDAANWASCGNGSLDLLWSLPVPKEGLSALAGQSQSYTKLLRQEESKMSGIRGMGTLSTC